MSPAPPTATARAEAKNAARSASATSASAIDLHPALAHARGGDRVVAGSEHVRPPARHAVHAVRVQVGRGHDVDAQADDARARARRRAVELADERGFGFRRAQDHARARHGRGDRRQVRGGLVVEQRHEHDALGDVGQRVHRRRHGEVDEQERVVAVGRRAHVREQFGAAQPLVEQRLRALFHRGAAAPHREQRLLVRDAVRRVDAKAVHQERLGVIGARHEEVRIGRIRAWSSS